MKRFVSLRPEQLASLTDFIHDSWFNRDQIEFDPKMGIMNIPFAREKWEDRELVGQHLFVKKYRVQKVEYILRLFHVKGYQIHEPYERGPGPSDLLLCIRYDESKKEIWIETDFARGIQISVSDFEVFVIETDRVLQTRIHSAIFTPDSVSIFDS